MKVIVSGYVGKKITGIGRNIISLLNNGSKEITYVIYVPFDMRDDFHFSNPNVIVKTYSISKNSSLKNLLWTTFKFPSVVKKEKGDLALIPNFTLLLFKKAPTVVIMHDLIEFNVSQKFSRLKMFYRTKIADPLTAKKATHIITVSQNSKNDIVKFLGIKAEKVSVIYDGVDSLFFKPEEFTLAAKEYFQKKGITRNYILYVGTIDNPGKNSISVIKAYEKIRNEKKYDGLCVLAGMPGSGFDFVKQYADKSAYSSDIIFTGYFDDCFLPVLYSKCDCFLFLSLYEGFGMPPLEALACGAKVIVSNTSSLPEVVGSCGILVAPTDIDKIGKDILVSQAKGNRESWLQRFEWKDLSKQFENVLINIGEKRNGKQS
jgi:glycosyltransferase involved in cell wall biosynthesis